MDPVRMFGPGDEIDGPVYVGIDPSLTGFAVCVLQPPDRYSIRVLSPRSRGSERLANIRWDLSNYLSLYDVADIAVEGTVVHSASASVLGELTGVVKEYCFTDLKKTPLMVPPMSLKKYVCGSAKGTSKSLILLHAYKKWGVELSDDNAADAYGIARICAGLSDTTYEAEVVLKLGDPKHRA